METDFGYSYDISWDTDLSQDVVYIDTGDGGIYLTSRDLKELGGLLDDNPCSLSQVPGRWAR